MTQWLSNGPPGEVTTISIDLTTLATIYLGTINRGFFKSVNGRANWSSAGLTTPDVDSLAIDLQSPTTMGDGIFKSANGRACWSASNQGLASAVTSAPTDPRTPTTLYAATRGGAPGFPVKPGRALAK